MAWLWLIVGLVSAAAPEGDELMTLQTVNPAGELLELRFAHGDDFEASALAFVTSNALDAGEGCATPACVARLVAAFFAFRPAFRRSVCLFPPASIRRTRGLGSSSG